MTGARFTVSGQVQGVGFRPTVWRLAHEMGLTGDVKNTGEGVVIQLWGDHVATFPDRLHSALPPLARIERLDVTPLTDPVMRSASCLTTFICFQRLCT